MKIFPILPIVVLLLVSVTVGFLYHKNKVTKENKVTNPYGNIIILNGPSGSGKSSIQKEFQKSMMPHLWLKVGIDNLFDNAMPEISLENLIYWQSPNLIRWISESKDKQGNNVITLHVGEEGERAVYAMNSAIAAYAENGCNIIVDYIAYHEDWLKDLQHKVKNFKTYYVAVKIPLETLEEREAARGTSPKGHARSHYANVYGSIFYDLEVNSGQQSAFQIAMQIKELVTKK